MNIIESSIFGALIRGNNGRSVIHPCPSYTTALQGKLLIVMQC